MKQCNSNCSCKVKFDKKISESFEVGTGLRQGDSLSPTLFNVMPEKVIRTMLNCQEMELLRNKKLIAYANDIMVISNSRVEVIIKTANLIMAAKLMGLAVNQNKTKYMIIHIITRNTIDLIICHYNFQGLTNFKSMVTNINNINNMYIDKSEYFNS